MVYRRMTDSMGLCSTKVKRYGPDFNLSHLKQLEAESIHIIGKWWRVREPGDDVFYREDSSVILHLARKAFHPGPLRLSSACRHHLQVQGNDKI